MTRRARVLPGMTTILRTASRRVSCAAFARFAFLLAFLCVGLTAHADETTKAFKKYFKTYTDTPSRVEAVLSLPGGVFQPYSGVKTSALIFRQGERTERVMFLHASNDGFKLDANHDQSIEADDLPGLIDAFASRDERWMEWQSRNAAAPWTHNW